MKVCETRDRTWGKVEENGRGRTNDCTERGEKKDPPKTCK